MCAFTKILMGIDMDTKGKKTPNSVTPITYSIAVVSKWLSGLRNIYAPVLKCYGGLSVGASSVGIDL